MSATLKWKPVHKEGRDLSDAFKFILRKTYHGEKAVVDGDDVPFLQGIETAGSVEVAKDAQRLIAAIQQHGAIEVWEET